MVNADYNPRDISQYFGKTFVTASGSHYGLTFEGRITGRSSMEGYEIEMLAGFEPKRLSGLTFADKKGIDELILEEGREPKVGLQVVMSLTEEAALQSGRKFLRTSPVVEIVDGE